MQTEPPTDNSRTDTSIQQISIHFDGRARAQFERLADEPAARTAEPYATRLLVRTEGEAAALLAEFTEPKLLQYEPQLIQTCQRVRHDLIEALNKRGYSVENGDLQERDLLADGGLPTCESCDQPYTVTVTVGPGETRRSCGCEVATDGGAVCTTKLCHGDAEFAYWQPEREQFSRALAPEDPQLTDGDLAPYVCADCKNRLADSAHYESDQFVRPDEKLATDGGSVISACPDCDSTHIRTTPGGSRGSHSDVDSAYRCLDCQTAFDDPHRRERRGQHSTDGVAKQLVEADPDDLRTDGGEITVEMLEMEPANTVYLTGHHGRRKQSVHTDADCRKLEAGETYRERTVQQVPADWQVCRICLGVAPEGGVDGDPNETRRELSNTDPEELGLSPLGEGELRTDGGIPESLDALASTCESCGGDVEPQYLEDGECPGCVYGGDA